MKLVTYVSPLTTAIVKNTLLFLQPSPAFNFLTLEIPKYLKVEIPKCFQVEGNTSSKASN